MYICLPLTSCDLCKPLYIFHLKHKNVIFISKVYTVAQSMWRSAELQGREKLDLNDCPKHGVCYMFDCGKPANPACMYMRAAKPNRAGQKCTNKRNLNHNMHEPTCWLRPLHRLSSAHHHCSPHALLCQSTTPIQTASLGGAMPRRPGYKPTPCESMCQLVLHITTAAPAQSPSCLIWSCG